MGKKKVEHVVFDGMRQIKKKVNISKYNQNTQKNFLSVLIVFADVDLLFYLSHAIKNNMLHFLFTHQAPPL